MMVVTWHALYEIATLLVDAGIFACSLITAYIALRNESHKNDNDRSKNKKK